MNKTVLYLMNGFGIEQKDSVDVYNAMVMPNLDALTKEYLFSSLEAKSFDLESAYYNFCTGYDKPLTYPFLDTYASKLNDNPNFKNYLNTISTSGRIHLFVFLNSLETLEHIKGVISSTAKNNTLFLHVILTGTDLNDYKEIDRLLSKINLEMKNVKLGSIVGVNTFVNEAYDYVGLLKSGVGEKWHELSKKLTTLETNKVLPSDVKGFYVNDKFMIEEMDSIFFLNYEFIRSSKFMENIKMINKNPVFSLFPMEDVAYPLYIFPTSNTSFVSDLHSIGAKALVMIDSKVMNSVNYYANGLKKVSDPSLLFLKTDTGILENEAQLQQVLTDPQFQLIIISCSIADVAMIDELKNKLTKIDTCLGYVKNICLQNKYNLLVSSLFGIKKQLFEDRYVKKLVNFNSKVPILFVHDTFGKAVYKIGAGNIRDLESTTLKLVNSTFKGTGLIAKKTFLDKLFKK